MPRRQFDLPEADVECLTGLGLEWETIVEGGQRWLLVHDYSLPGIYTTTRVLVALAITPSYPATEIDMVCFFPGLALASGKAIGALGPQQIDGNQFQRWSRHRTSTNPWRSGEDDLCSHLALVDEWLRREEPR